MTRCSATARPSFPSASAPRTAPILGRAIDVAPQNLMDLGRGKAYRRTLINGAPSEAQYLETTKAELETGQFEANVRMTRAKFARPRKLVERLGT